MIPVTTEGGFHVKSTEYLATEPLLKVSGEPGTVRKEQF